MSRLAGAASPLAVSAVGWASLAVAIHYGVWESGFGGGGPGPGFFPGLAGAALAALGLWSAVADPVAPEKTDGTLARQIAYIAGLFGFALLMEVIGGIADIVLLFLWILAVIERLPWKLVGPVTVGAALGAWLLFDRLLQVPLPRGMFG